jgi:ankyrin repeat protein
LTFGALVDSTDDDQHTPLHVAAQRGSLNVLEHLRIWGSNPNARDEDLETPSFKAFCNYDEDIILALQRFGADFSLPNKFGFTPLYYALSGEDPSALLYLAQEKHSFHNYDNIIGSPLLMFVFMEELISYRMITFILNADYDLTACRTITENIFQATSHTSSTILKRFIYRISSIGVQDMVNFRPDNWYTALYLAASGGYSANVELLIKAGAQVELEGGRCGTALMGPCDAGKLASVKVLVRHGAIVEYRNSAGEIVSAISMAKYHPQVVHGLLVLRHIYQRKLCQTEDECSSRKEILPWSRSKPVEIFFPRQPKTSTLEYLYLLGKARIRWAGKVYYPFR